MKFRMNLLASSIVVLGVATVVAGCGGSSGHGTRHQSNTNVPVRTNLQQQYLYQLVFANMVTGAPIADELQVRFEGPAVDAGLVVDATGQSVKGKTYTTAAAMGVATNFSDAAPWFNVVVGNASKGWLQSGTQINRSTSQQGSQTIEVKLNNVNAAAAVNADPSLGAALASQEIQGGPNGQLTGTAPVSVATPVKNATNAEGTSEPVGVARITLPAGVSALDDSGNKIALSGPIQISAVKFSNAETEALSAFPGGFAPVVSAPANVLNGVDPSQGSFITDGFAQFNLTDSTGRALKKFDQPLTLALDLPKTSLNPDGTALQPGDVYPVWSYDEQKGAWVFEKNGIIREKTPADPNFYEVSFETNHLSFWALARFVQTCTASLNLQRTAGDTRELSVQITGTTGSRFYREIPFVYDSNLTLARYPLNQMSTVKVVDSANNVVGQLPATNLCQGGTVAISAPPVSEVRARVNVQVTESCPDGSNKRPAPTFVSFWNGRTLLEGYAKTASGASAAEASFDNILVPTNGTLYVWDSNVSKQTIYNLPVTVGTVTNGVLNYPVNLPTLSCRIPTGSSGRN